MGFLAWQGCSHQYCAQLRILNLSYLFSDLKVSVSFYFFLPTSSFLFFVSLCIVVALELWDLEMDGPDLICALEHNTPVSIRYATF
jgi:hypothetical protein